MASVHALALIYDIRGFTRAARHIEAAQLGAFAKAAHAVVVEAFGARPPDFLKNLGDGCLLVWETGPEPEPALVHEVLSSAVRGARAYSAYVDEQAAQGLDLPRRIGVGIAWGKVSKHDDYYGVALNLAARLQALARPEGFAVDATVHDLVGSRDRGLLAGFRRHRVRLKGLGRVLAWIQRPFSFARVGARVASWAALLALPAIYLGVADAGLEVPGAASIRRALDARSWSVFRPAHARGHIDAQAARLRATLAERLLAVRDAEGMIQGDFTKPIPTDVWISSQASFAILRGSDLPQATRAQVLPALAAAFAPGRYVEVDGRAYGWIAHEGLDFTIAEPALWTTMALAALLAEGDLVPPAERATWLARLRRAQEATVAHLPHEGGGWNMYPDQAVAQDHSPYTSTLALMALLETRASGLPWQGSTVRRDALLRETAAWLQGEIVTAGPLTGWRATWERATPVSLGLTLQAHAALLRAEAEAGVALRDEVLASIRDHVARLEGTNLDQPVNAGEYTLTFRTHEGRDVTRSESINLLWHPWGIELCARWLARLERAGAPQADLVAARRVLGRLVVDLGPEALETALSGYTFVAAETLLGLAALYPAR